MTEFKIELKQINTRMIFSDDYQRDINTSAVRRIVKNFDPNIVNAPKVSYRDQKYWVFDGQHTIAALKQMNGGEDLMVECKVYYGMTYEDEARLFSLQDGVVTKVTIEDKLKALREAKDETVLAFIKATEACGFECDFKSHNGKKRLICYKTAYDIFVRKGEAYYKNLLNIIVSAWAWKENSSHRFIVSGLDCFLKDFGDDEKYDPDRLVKKLSGITPNNLIANGKEVRGLEGAKRFEWVIFDEYNKSLKHKLEWKR